MSRKGRENPTKLFKNQSVTRAFLWKWPWTLITWRWLLIRVGSFMNFKIIISYKWLWTLITWKRFLISVGSSWIFISLFRENDFGHWSHEKYSSPLWIILWLLKCISCVNDFGHWSHGKGFSPFWFLLWILKWLFCKNDFGHWSQGKGFSPFWFLLWIFQWLFCKNDFEHWSQGNILFIFLSYQSKLKALRNGSKDLYTSTRFLIKFSCI